MVLEDGTTPWRADFPLTIAHPDLAYFDQAATGQYPAAVSRAMMTWMTQQNAPIHRGLYDLAYTATSAYEEVRHQVATVLGVSDPRTIIFTSGTTASLNLVAQSLGPQIVTPDAEIIVSAAEHHSNFLPWQQLARQAGAQLLIAPVTSTGAIDEAWVLAHINPQTRLVALAHETNVSGAVLKQARAIADAVHAVGGVFVLDGAQAMGHEEVDVMALDCDFYAFSAHKLNGPSGVGVLYGRATYLNKMPPMTLGGGMVETVSATQAEWLPIPARFEAGSPNSLGIIGLGAALTYLQPRRLAMAQHERRLTTALWAALASISGVRLVSDPKATAIVSFTLANCHAHDLATWLNERQIAVRAGHHCAQPFMQVIGESAVVRASIGPMTTANDVARLAAGVKDAATFFRGG